MRGILAAVLLLGLSACGQVTLGIPTAETVVVSDKSTMAFRAPLFAYDGEAEGHAYYAYLLLIKSASPNDIKKQVIAANAYTLEFGTQAEVSAEQPDIKRQSPFYAPTKDLEIHPAEYLLKPKACVFMDHYNFNLANRLLHRTLDIRKAFNANAVDAHGSVYIVATPRPLSKKSFAFPPLLYNLSRLSNEDIGKALNEFRVRIERQDFPNEVGNPIISALYDIFGTAGEVIALFTTDNFTSSPALADTQNLTAPNC